jgi:uncharacterized protein
MSIFIDTSALYTLLDRDDANHDKAKRAWSELLHAEKALLTKNYVLVESFALIQHRLGMEAVRGFEEDVLPVIGVEWIKESAHRSGVSAFLAASKRKLSFVDCVSFENMLSLGIKKAFAFGPHFNEQGSPAFLK